MTFLATTRVAVIRGGSTDPLGDEIDANGGSAVVGYESLPASIIERAKAVYDPASGTRRTVRVVTGRIPAGVKLLEGDRIRDNTTRVVYAISESAAVARSIAGMSSLTLDLKQA